MLIAQRTFVLIEERMFVFMIKYSFGAETTQRQAFDSIIYQHISYLVNSSFCEDCIAFNNLPEFKTVAFGSYLTLLCSNGKVNKFIHVVYTALFTTIYKRTLLISNKSKDNIPVVITNVLIRTQTADFVVLGFSLFYWLIFSSILWLACCLCHNENRYSLFIRM